jgi:metal-responsive CopG/Arc/MetJ family transcriptional regulator
MYPKKSEEFTRISFKISKELLADFNEYALSKNYQQLDEAIIDLIKNELKEK